MKKSLILIAVAALFISCDALIDSIDGDGNSSKTYQTISYDNPKIGQTSVYVGVYIENYSNQNMTCIEYSDSLIWKVLRVEDDTIELMQIFVYNNMILKAADEFTRDTSYCTLELYNDSINVVYPVPIDTRIFGVPNLYLGYYKPLPQHTLIRASADNSCLQRYQLASKVEYLYESLFIDGTRYSDVSMYVDNIEMQVDGPGFTFIYSMDEGLLACYVVNPWTDTGSGWKRVK